MDAGRYGRPDVKDIPADEPVVILRASNISTPRILEMGATLARDAGESDDYVEELRDRAARMRAWQADDPERTTATEPRQAPEPDEG